jgi:hypothetical protein
VVPTVSCVSCSPMLATVLLAAGSRAVTGYLRVRAVRLPAEAASARSTPKGSHNRPGTEDRRPAVATDQRVYTRC